VRLPQVGPELPAHVTQIRAELLTGYLDRVPMVDWRGGVGCWRDGTEADDDSGRRDDGSRCFHGIPFLVH